MSLTERNEPSPNSAALPFMRIIFLGITGRLTFGQRLSDVKINHLVVVLQLLVTLQLDYFDGHIVGEGMKFSLEGFTQATLRWEKCCSTAYTAERNSDLNENSFSLSYTCYLLKVSQGAATAYRRRSYCCSSGGVNLSSNLNLIG
jgi:hypothetical protein